MQNVGNVVIVKNLFFDGTALSTFYHKGDTVVCGPCADIGVPCGGCNELLSFREAGGILKAISKFWHVKCFVCTGCKKSITKLKVSKNQQPYCDVCIIPAGESDSTPSTPSAEPLSSPLPEPEPTPTPSQQTAPEPTPEPSSDGKKPSECWGCKKVIDGRIITAMEKPWHPACFVCAECKNPFGTKSFFTQTGSPVCTDCNLKAAPVCGGCNEKLTGKWLTAFDKKWHNECFVCTECRKAFEGGKFKLLPSRPGFPFCSSCAETLNNS